MDIRLPTSKQPEILALKGHLIHALNLHVAKRTWLAPIPQSAFHFPENICFPLMDMCHDNK